jgi:hypothetical protein
MLALRAEKYQRKIRRAARKLAENGDLTAALPKPAVPADQAPDEDLPPEWSGPPGPPPWHPEHRMNESEA